MQPALAADTTQAATAAQVEVWRRMSATEKLGLVASITAMVQWLEEEGWRRRNPSMTDREIHVAISRHRLGEQLAERVHAVAGRES